MSRPMRDSGCGEGGAAKNAKGAKSVGTVSVGADVLGRPQGGDSDRINRIDRIEENEF